MPFSSRTVTLPGCLPVILPMTAAWGIRAEDAVHGVGGRGEEEDVVFAAGEGFFKVGFGEVTG